MSTFPTMKCLDDSNDELIQSIEYARFAVGTKLQDGSIKEKDSSGGDIGLFCRGLLYKLMKHYHHSFTLIQGEEVTMLQVDTEKGVVRSVTTINQEGDDEAYERLISLWP